MTNLLDTVTCNSPRCIECIILDKTTKKYITLKHENTVGYCTTHQNTHKLKNYKGHHNVNMYAYAYHVQFFFSLNVNCEI